MNGQPYTNSGSNSANGTPTPSSTSYPASLSSHSSRDTSPSRLPPNLNHINPDKPHYYNNYPQNYKNLPDTSPNANSIGYGSYSQGQNENFNSNKSFSSPHVNNHTYTAPRPTYTQSPRHIVSPQQNVSDLPVNQQKSPLVSQSSVSHLSQSNVLQKQIVGQKPDSSPMQERSQESYSSLYYNSSQGLPPNALSNLQLQSPPQFRQDLFSTPPIVPSRVEQTSVTSVQGLAPIPQKPTSPQNQNTPEGTVSQLYNVSQGISSSSENLLRPSPNPSYNNYPPTSSQPGAYGVGASPRLAYPAQSAQAQRPTPDEPLSSGPPRTNVLGIIPYSNDCGGTVVQSMISTTRTMTSQSTPPVSMQPPRQVIGPPYSGYNDQQPSGVSNQAQTRMMSGPPPRPPINSRLPPYSAQQPTVVTRAPQYMNQYGQKPLDSYGAHPQSSPNYQNSSYPQENIGVIPPYSHPGSYYPGTDDLTNQMGNVSVTQAGFNRLWGKDTFDLLKCRDILPQGRIEAPPIHLQQELYESNNCSPEIFRCTLTKIPETKSLLDKSRLPLGVLIHPFKDLNQLSVIQCSIIVRCRGCRTYINPFVYFVDSKHWKCNLCFRVNDLPDEFHYDPFTKTYGHPSRRPEIKSATIEFIAPSEYMVRPPQPAAYVFVIDVSRIGAEAGYLQVFCNTLLSQLEALPGDSRTSVAFITFDSAVHFYSLAEVQSQPHQMVVVDIDDMFVPCPENLLVNLNECLGLVRDLLKELPAKYKESYEVGSAVGPALQAAYKLLAPTGGRITVFQSCLANCGPGSLSAREDPSQRTAENVNQTLLNPVTDFYKKLALDCSGQQIAVDLFILNGQYVDLASLCGVSRFSGGCIYHFPLFNVKNHNHVDKLQRTLQRYLCRKIGFESVMRLRCTRGLSIHTFHGNFFVRSTDLLSLPNINPDAGFGMQVSIDENLSDIQNVCFQAALLYTSSKGERRIRVHTLCLPIATNLSDVLHSADQQCIIGLLAKMAVDRCHQSSLSDAREAFVNVVADMLSAFKLTQSNSPSSSLLAPGSLKLLPLYILSLLKYTAFRVGQSTRLDDRIFAMCQMKTLPLSQLMLAIYPDLYAVHNLMDCSEVAIGEETVVQPVRLHLSAERIDSFGVYLLDDGENIIIYVGHNISPNVASSLFNVPSFSSLNPQICDLPEVDSPESERLRNLVTFLQNEKPVPPTVQIIRDDSPQRQRFLEKLVEDKTESGHSYYEFLQRVKMLLK